MSNDRSDRDRPAGRSAAGNYRLRDSSGKVPADLFDATAMKIAESLVNADRQGKARVAGVSRHQFRRLFDEVKRIKRQLDNQRRGNEKGAWMEAVPKIKLIKSKVAYVTARNSSDKKNGKYYKALQEFFVSGIDQVENQADYDAFVTLMEAVYGFYYERGGSNT